MNRQTLNKVTKLIALSLYFFNDIHMFELHDRSINNCYTV